jgi:glycosyltransferase involved in cell wall biosynthesis
MDLGIVIPCYNEYERITHSDFESFLDQRQKISLCFVNDGSNDKTMTLLKKLHQSKPDRINIINLKKNKGKASAVKAGMNFFFDKKKFDKIAFFGC